jgi:hypothetical protein
MAYETFDIDLREGKAREDAFVHVMLRSKVEHKRDKKAARTGNIAVEIACKDRNDKGVPSGINITTAEYWAVEYMDGCWLVLPTEIVKNLTRLAAQQDRKHWIGDGGRHLNVLVPIEWFVKPLSPKQVEP